MASDRRFRADVEGLRAVAVVLVLLFHADVPGFAGGYVGVDVFFVLSGYLITRLLLRERQETGTIRLGRFYARRLRRLLPASTLVIVATLVAGRFVLPPLLVAPTAVDGLWAAGWVANLRFIRVGLDYLAADGFESPLLHYWSLAVEEQFYLLWPALILLVARGRHARVLQRIGGLLVVVGVGSLVASMLVTPRSPVVAYFGLPTRAWELAAGAALALAAARGLAPRAATARWLSWLGLGAIVTAAVTYTTATPFPGWTALVPVLGTVAVLYAGERGDASGAGSVLRVAPLQVIGRWSYSLYLWHWPVLVYGEVAAGRSLSAWERVGALGLSVGLAWATFRLVEDPVRRAASSSTTGRSLALGGSLVTASVVGALVVLVTVPSLIGTGGGPGEASADERADEASADERAGEASADETSADDRADEARLTAQIASSAEARLLPAGLQPPLALASRTLPVVYDDGCFGDWDTVEPADCTYGHPDADRTVVLYGDSHAAQWFPALEQLAIEHGWRLVVLAKPSCPSIDIVTSRSGGEAPYPSCDPWRGASLERIAAEDPEVLVLSNARTYLALDDDLDPVDVGRPEYLEAGHERAIAQLQRQQPDTRIVLVGVIARPGFDVPTCLSDNLEDMAACWADPTKAVNHEVLEMQRSVAERQGVAFVDPTPWLCTAAVCPTVIGEQLVYSDQAHLSPPYVRTLAPLLDATLGLVDGA